jgi:hypothetical protein
MKEGVVLIIYIEQLLADGIILHPGFEPVMNSQ